jgi:lipoate-protein ligase B
LLRCEEAPQRATKHGEARRNQTDFVSVNSIHTCGVNGTPVFNLPDQLSLQIQIIGLLARRLLFHIL